MKRRDFVKLGGKMAALSAGISAVPSKVHGDSKKPSNDEVQFLYDGLNLSPSEYAALLMRMADEGKIEPDYYSNGGVVEELETAFARWLGKESAVFMPTGTLANHVAMRKLAGNRRRAIVQEVSHIYNDSGDCCQTLSGMNLIPLGKDRVQFTLEEVEAIVRQTKSGRVKTGVGCIAIESPVRRKDHRIVRLETVKAITDFAKKESIGTHFDGARLFIQCVHTDIHPSKYSACFDTVYTSLYKCFNAASGAILAGPKSFTKDLYHTRRMFGGGMPWVWPFAAVALHYVDTYLDDYKVAVQRAGKMFDILEKDGRFSVHRFEDGTHRLQLKIEGSNLSGFRDKLSKQGIRLRSPGADGIWLNINPSINRRQPEDLARAMIEALD